MAKLEQNYFFLKSTLYVPFYRKESQDLIYFFQHLWYSSRI